jgi:hypothetical protein
MAGRVVADGGSSTIPKVGTDRIVFRARHVHRAARARPAVHVDPGALSFGEDAEVVDRAVGRRELDDAHDLGQKDRGGGPVDAGDVRTWVWSEDVG